MANKRQNINEDAKDKSSAYFNNECLDPDAIKEKTYVSDLK